MEKYHEEYLASYEKGFELIRQVEEIEVDFPYLGIREIALFKTNEQADAYNFQWGYNISIGAFVRVGTRDNCGDDACEFIPIQDVIEKTKNLIEQLELAKNKFDSENSDSHRE